MKDGSRVLSDGSLYLGDCTFCVHKVLCHKECGCCGYCGKEHHTNFIRYKKGDKIINGPSCKRSPL